MSGESRPPVVMGAVGVRLGSGGSVVVSVFIFKKLFTLSNRC